MDRLAKLAENDDRVKSGQNNRRVARIRQYDEEILRLREIVMQAEQAQATLTAAEGTLGSWIVRDLHLRCSHHISTAKTELIRLENERAMIARAVQR